MQILDSEALFPYEYPALFSIAIAFIGIWVFSAADNSPEGMREREQFRAQFIRSQTGIGIEREKSRRINRSLPFPAPSGEGVILTGSVIGKCDHPGGVCRTGGHRAACFCNSWW